MRPSEDFNHYEPSMIVNSEDLALDRMESTDYKDLLAKIDEGKAELMNN